MVNFLITDISERNIIDGFIEKTPILMTKALFFLLNFSTKYRNELNLKFCPRTSRFRPSVNLFYTIYLFIFFPNIDKNSSFFSIQIEYKEKKIISHLTVYKPDVRDISGDIN